MKYLAMLSLMTLMVLTTSAQNSPKAKYKSGKIKIIVWENEKKGKYGPYTEKNFKIEKFYFDKDEYKETDYYSFEELLELRAVIDKAIMEESVEVEALDK